MAQNKLEAQIKEQLNAREIKPTEMAWDRLDAMLSVAEEKKTVRSTFLSFRFIGIAASILVFVSLGLFFFNQKEISTQPENNVVVNEEVKQNNSKENTTTINGNTGIDNDGLEGFNQQEEQVAAATNNNSSTNKKSSKSFNQNNQKTTINPLINQEKEVQIEKQEAVAQKELPVVASSKENVLSKTNPVNVDDLLASVEKTPKSNAKPKVKVNANSLLSQVDGELDQSFRDKVLTKISKNYQEVKVALATRNQE
jgi:hypothetical protein